MLKEKITRRQALKVLLATTGGLTAAAFLPSKWLKPIVSAGVLPAHARASAHSLFDPTGNFQNFSDIFVYVYNGAAAANLMGIGIGAGVLPVHPAAFPGTAVNGVPVTLASISPAPSSATIGGHTLPWTVTTAVYSRALPTPAITNQAGIADFGILAVTYAVTTPISVVLHFTAPGCNDLDLTVILPST